MRLPLADAPRLQGVHVTTRVEPSAWDAFVLAHPEATGNHLWAWQHVYREAFGHEPRYLAALDAQDAIVGVLPLVMFQRWPLGRFVVSLPFVNYGGVLAEDGRVAQVLLDAAVEEARRIGATHIELRHTTPRFPELAVREHRVSMTRRLSPDCEQEWGNLDRKIRNQVRKAEKHGLTSHVGGCELLDEFYAVFAVNMRDLGTPVYPKAWFAQTIAHFPDRSRVFVVRQDGRAIAGALTFAHPRGVEIPSASSLRTHRALCPNTLLYWHILREAIAGGANRSTSDGRRPERARSVSSGSGEPRPGRWPGSTGCWRTGQCRNDRRRIRRFAWR